MRTVTFGKTQYNTTTFELTRPTPDGGLHFAHTLGTCDVRLEEALNYVGATESEKELFRKFFGHTDY